MENVDLLIKQLSLEEKASLCSGANFWYLRGIERLGIPSIMVTDGPHGLRKQLGDATQVGLTDSAPATCFPTASALAATWNRDLVYQVGVALGEACRQEKVGVILGPGMNIKRSPLCGRNFEYFSEDPYLTGEIAKSHVSGVQSQGVGTSIKHFAVNNQETRRSTTDSVVDERALREIYLAGYEIAVKGAQPWTVMCSYNRINGTYASDHRGLMTDILRDEWGHQGLVVTDWTAMNERVAALQAGVDLEMPGPAHANTAQILAAVASGGLEEAILDRAVARVLTVIGNAQAALNQDYTYDADAHHALARRVAGEGAVLLKNEGGLLPLPAQSRIALIGRFARQPRYQGAGSSQMNPSRLDNLQDELAALIGQDCITYAPGYTESGDEADEALIQEALAVAEHADTVVICAGLTDLHEVEGIDRRHLDLPAGHDALIKRLAAAHARVVVVLSNGAPVAMPWARQVATILEGYLGGQAGAGAIADILTGRVNPSGKLAETFPVRLADTPAQPYPGGPMTVEYRESLYVGYRYYDTAHIDVLYPFGHGLSYTTFAYRDLVVTPSEHSVTVRFTIENTGPVAGKEIAQIYVRDLESTPFRPDQELKGFAKADLQPGESVEVVVDLDQRAFAFYDVGARNWVVEGGDFDIRVGASSRDIRLTATCARDAHGAASPVDRSKLTAYYHVGQPGSFSQADFEALLGRAVPANVKPSKGGYTMTTALGDMQDSFIARQFLGLIKQQTARMIKDTGNPVVGLIVGISIQEMPLRGMVEMFGRGRVEALLKMINGRFVEGAWALLTSGSTRKAPEAERQGGRRSSA